MHRCFCWICGLIALLVICVAARGQATQPSTVPTTAATTVEENIVEFSSSEFGFKLMYPDWLRRMETNLPPGVALMLLRPKPDPAGTQAQILVVSPPDIRDASAYVETFQRAFSDARVLEQRDATLGGAAAEHYVVQGHQLQGGRDVRVEMIVTVRNDRLYSVLAMAEPAGFDSLRPTFQRVLESFEWTK